MHSAALSRRRVLERAIAGAGLVGAAGCLGDEDDGTTGTSNGNGGADGGETGAGGDGNATASDENEDGGDGNGGDGGSQFPEVEDPPAAVYLPTHREAMRVLEPVPAGDYVFVPAVTYPHRFWTVTGDTAERVEPTGDDDVHLMVIAADRETGTVVPVDASLHLETATGGEVVDERTPWPMLSQGMGFHFGDNVPLAGEGTYRVTGRIGALGARTTGAFADRFDESVTFEFAFDVDEDLRRLPLEAEYLEESAWGDPGALEPMGGSGSNDGGGTGSDDEDGNGSDDGGGSSDDHEDRGHQGVPYAALPPAEALPGTLQGAPTSGDAVLATTLVEPGSRFVDDDRPYLAVSPRTPYNGCVLPMATLEVALETAGGDVRSEGGLTATLDDEMGYHYGTPLEAVADGDELTVEPLAPPQVARHQGYETAFLEMDPTTLTLSL